MRVRRLHLLGTGSSMGVPVIGCHCPVCSNPSNARLRSSALVECDEGYFLIDPGPDLRTQLLRFGVATEGPRSLLGVLITHTHADHVAGIDELRIFTLKQRRPMPLLLSQQSYRELKARYSYLIDPSPLATDAAVRLKLQLLQADAGETLFEQLKIGYCSYRQAEMTVTGYRLGSCAYVTDIKHYGKAFLAMVSDQPLDLLLLSAGGAEPSPMHLGIEAAIELAQCVGARRTVLTHLSHTVDPACCQNELPDRISLGYDGLCLDLKCQEWSGDG